MRQLIKVLVIADYLGRKNTNPIRPEAAQMVGLHESGLVKITVLCSPESVLVEYYRERGIEVITHKIASKLSLRSMHFIRNQIKTAGYDILHLFHSRAISNGATAALGLPVKVVAYRGQTGSISRLDPFSYLNMLHPRIDRIVCVAKAVEKDLQDKVWSSDSKLLTIYKGHDLSWYQNAPSDLQKSGVPAGAFTLSLVANLRPRKGLHVLMQATHYFPPNAPIHILLVGGRPEDPAARKLVATAAYPERIHLLGYRDDAPEISAASDVVVLPTTKREGLSRAILEGMAYGRAAVVTDTGGNAELVVDGETGYVVPPNNPEALGRAIVRLWENPERCRQFGNAAQARVRTVFNVEQGVNKHLELYRQLVAEPE